MSSGSQKQRQLAIKKVQGRLHALPIETLEKLAKVPNDWAIPEKATTLPEGASQENGGKFILCFDYLNWDVCVFDHFDSTKGRALVRKLQMVAQCESSALPGLHLVRDNISNNPPYTSLFNGLSPDVEMKETELPDSGRIFFFITGCKFNIVSIETNHRNIY